MDNNQAIRFLRGDSSKKSADITLLAGQPFYETNTNKLYIGDGKTTLNNLRSITSSVESSINSTNNTINNLLSGFWYAIAVGALSAKVGDISLINTTGSAKLLPALCVDIYESSGKRNSVWQVNWREKTVALSSSNETSWRGGNTKWENTEIYKYLNNDVINYYFPTYLQNVITPVVKSMGNITIYSYAGGHSSYSDSGAQSSLWIPSAEEIWGTSNLPKQAYGPSPYDVSTDGSTQFEYYKRLLGANATPATGRDSDSKLASTASIWLRNYTGPIDSNFYPRFYTLDANGSLQDTGSTTEQSRALALTICFVVSPQG